MDKKIVRLKITDFINSPIEDTAISFLKMIKENAPVFSVTLWYYRNDIDKEDLISFRKKYKDDIEFLELDIIELGAITPYVWYDIVGTSDENRLDNFKFRSVYMKQDEIINCIMEFNTMIKFDIQKNSYKNVKNRNNRVKTLGRQNSDKEHNI